MDDRELLDLINTFSDEKIQEIESVDSNTNEDSVVVVGISNKIKRIQFTLTTEGDFSYRFLGVRFANAIKG
jgi:hypothetical protein